MKRGDDWAYAWGYRKAADHLLMDATTTNQMPVLFFPIFFLYRHTMEITLKELIRETEGLIRLFAMAAKPTSDNDVFDDRLITITPAHAQDPQDVERDLARTHNLKDLHTRLTQRLKLVEAQDLWDGVRVAVEELHNLDPNGERFRYARVKKAYGSWAFPSGTQIDTHGLSKSIGAALDTLQDGLGDWLLVQYDYALCF